MILGFGFVVSFQLNDLGFFIGWAMFAEKLDFDICDIADSTLIAMSMECWSNREFSDAMPPAMTNYKFTSCC
ncbi:MAG: hypothetical protein ACYTXY_07365 [Nostoc sp.]